MDRRTRLCNLYRAADARIEALSGVRATEKQSFRIDDRVFIRIDLEDDVRAYGFKLTGDGARSACSNHPCVTPMKFGGMGKKAWVSFRLTRKDQLTLLMKLIVDSHALFKTR